MYTSIPTHMHGCVLSYVQGGCGKLTVDFCLEWRGRQPFSSYRICYTHKMINFCNLCIYVWVCGKPWYLYVFILLIQFGSCKFVNKVLAVFLWQQKSVSVVLLYLWRNRRGAEGGKVPSPWHFSPRNFCWLSRKERQGKKGKWRRKEGKSKKGRWEIKNWKEEKLQNEEEDLFYFLFYFFI